MRKLAVLVGPVGALALSAQSAMAGHVACNSVVSGYVTLHDDIGPCDGHGLIVNADGTTINLNGHKIIGDDDSNGDGVSIDGFNDVTVKNGTIEDFLDGVRVRDSDRVTLYKLLLTSNREDGVDAEKSEYLTLVKVRANDNKKRGADIDSDSHRFKIKYSQFNGNDNEHGVDVDDAERGLIKSSQAIDNDNAGFDLKNSERTSIIKSTAKGNGDEGFEIKDVDESVFLKNVSKGNDDVGFDFASGSTENKLRGNKATGNAEHGFEFSDSSKGNTLTGNPAKGNGTEKQSDGFKTEAGDIRFFKNIALMNTRHGFHSHHADDTVFSGNTAAKNDDMGIRSSNGSTGGPVPNVAFDNGDDLQCSTDVLCIVFF